MRLGLFGLRRGSSPEQVRREWKRRLRSGKYRQGHGALKHVGVKGDAHCCLGILCEIAVEAGVIPPGIPDSYDERVSFGGMYGVPPSEVTDWAGLDHTQVEQLVTANDRDRLGFSAIADLIEDMPTV